MIHFIKHLNELRHICDNKVFKDTASTGKSTMGWFHGFKLHTIINNKEDLLSFAVTQASLDDKTHLFPE